MENPIDYLPVDVPFKDPNPPNDIWFYHNVIKKVLPDIIEMQNTGIPINLDRVKEAEESIDKVLEHVNDVINNSKIVKDYLKSKYDVSVEERSKDYYDIKYDRKNTTIRSFIVNSYLRDHNESNNRQPVWSIKDIKLYASILGSRFLAKIADNTEDAATLDLCNKYIEEYKQYKADIYNKNLREKIKNKIKFNPNSKQQIGELLNYLGFHSEETTPTGREQWNRDQLLILKDKIDE